MFFNHEILNTCCCRCSRRRGCRSCCGRRSSRCKRLAVRSDTFVLKVKNFILDVQIVKNIFKIIICFVLPEKLLVDIPLIFLKKLVESCTCSEFILKRFCDKFCFTTYATVSLKTLLVEIRLTVVA